MLSGITKTPELMLSESESTELAKALTTVNSFYNVEVAEKTMAWMNLAMVGGMIYGTRLVAIRQRRQSERKPDREQPASDPLGWGQQHVNNDEPEFMGFPGMGAMQ